MLKLPQSPLPKFSIPNFPIPVSPTQVSPSERQSQAVNCDDLSINDVQPLYLSTQNFPRPEHNQIPPSVLSCGQQISTGNDGISNGTKLSMLISKVGDIVSAVQDLKRSIILLVENKARHSTFSEVLSSNSSGMHSQIISNTAEKTLQSQIASRQILAETPMIPKSRIQLESRPVMNEEPQPIPVRISNGSRGSHGSSNPSK